MSLLTNAALGIGFQLLSGLLKPRTQDKSPDSIPNPSFGTIVYRGWGTHLCPGMMNFFLDSSLNDRVQLDKYNFAEPEEATSYSSFLISNPDNCTILALRINGQVAATKMSSMPISRELKGARLVQAGTGLTHVNDLKFRFKDGTQIVSDRIYVKGSQPKLVYNGQSLLIIDSALRTNYGGRGSAVSAILSNDPAGLSTPASGAYGFGDIPVTLEYSKGSLLFGFANTGGIETFVNLPRGYQYSRQVAVFRQTSGTARDTTYSYFAFGTLSETHLSDASVLPVVSVESAGLSNTPAGTPGSLSQLPYSSALVVVQTDRVHLYKSQQLGKTIILANPAPSPFYAKNGQIFDGNGAVVGICSSDENVYGWDGKMFCATSYTPNTTAPPATVVTYTTLHKVITGLMTFETGVEIGVPYEIDTRFNDDTLVGYSTNSQDVTGDISNLLGMFRKIVFQKRDGTLKFSNYPDSASVSIPVKAHISAPVFNYKAADEIPDSFEFSYRDIDRQFDSTSIKLGGDTSRQETISSEIVCGRKEANVYAQTMRNQIVGQTLEGTLHLSSEWNKLEGGDVLTIEPLNPNSTPVKVIALRVETGADGTIRVEFVNFVPYKAITPFSATDGSDYIPPSLPSSSIRLLIDCEPKSNRVGLTAVLQNDSSPITWEGTTPLVPNLTFGIGSVVSHAGYKITLNMVQGVPVAGQELYLIRDTDGRGTYIKPGTVTQLDSDTYELEDCTIGLYGSSNLPDLSGFTAVQVNENNTIDDSYLAFSYSQRGELVSYTYPTRKRLREPQLASIAVHGDVVIFTRQKLRLATDDSYGTVTQSCPDTTFLVSNITQSLTSAVNGTSGQLISLLPGTVLGDQIRIVEVNSLTDLASPIGAVVNNWVVA